MVKCRYCGAGMSEYANCKACGLPPTVRGNPVYTVTSRKKQLLLLKCKSCNQTSAWVERIDWGHKAQALAITCITVGLAAPLLLVDGKSIYCARCGHRYKR